MRGYRRVEGRYRPIRRKGGRLKSQVLGLEVEGGELRLYDPRSGERLLIPLEQAEARHQAEEKTQGSCRLALIDGSMRRLNGMKKIAFIFGVAAVLFFLLGRAGWAKEVPYTLEDRDRLIRIEASLREFEIRMVRIETSLREFKESVDRRFEQVDKRFAEIITFMWVLGSVLGGLVAVTIGFAVWDRRTALAPALRRSQGLEEREERIERALRELAQKDPNVAEALRHVGLL